MIAKVDSYNEQVGRYYYNVLITFDRVIQISEVYGLYSSSGSVMTNISLLESLVKELHRAFEQGITPYPGTSSAVLT